MGLHLARMRKSARTNHSPARGLASCGYVSVVAAILEMAEAATMEGREMSSTLVPCNVT